MHFVIDHLQKRFDTQEVLRDVSGTFESGRIYGLLGRNGAGKTTLFNCLNRDLTADGGSFFLEEDGVRREVTADDVGYVLSTPTVPEFLTGREFLKFLLDIHRERLPQVLDPDAYLDWVAIAPADRDKLLKDYSHGMKNKMQMLVYLILQPPVLLLDEPLTSLDVVVAEEMKALLRRQRDGRVLIVSTHLLDLAMDLCDEIVLLHRGVLEPIARETLDDADFKARILDALREEDGRG